MFDEKHTAALKMGLTFTKLFSCLFAKKEMRSNIFGKERGSWLENFTYAVFGLKNKQYEHFNKVVSDWFQLALEMMISELRMTLLLGKNNYGQSWTCYFVMKMIYQVALFILLRCLNIVLYSLIIWSHHKWIKVRILQMTMLCMTFSILAGAGEILS